MQLSFAGSFNSRVAPDASVGRKGGAGRGCTVPQGYYWTEHGTGASHVRSGAKVNCSRFRKRGYDSGCLLSNNTPSFSSVSVQSSSLSACPFRFSGQVFVQILQREAFWVFQFFDEPVLWRIIPPKNEHELLVTQTPRLRLGNAPNEFNGRFRNQHLPWDMPQQQGPLG